MEYRTEQIILCGFLFCHEHKKEDFSEMFYHFLSENIKNLGLHSLEYIYCYAVNQDKTWQEIKEKVKAEIKERKNE